MIAKVVILLSVAFISTEGAGLGAYSGSGQIASYGGHGIAPSLSAYSTPAITTPSLSSYHTPAIATPAISSYHGPALPNYHTPVISSHPISSYSPIFPAYHSGPAITSYNSAPISSYSAHYPSHYQYPTSYGVPSYGHASFGERFGYGY